MVVANLKKEVHSRNASTCPLQQVLRTLKIVQAMVSAEHISL